jgi:acetylornithine deacetylase
MTSHKAVLEEVFGNIDAEDLVEFTREVARIPSVHGNEYAIGEAFFSHASRLGLTPQKMEVEKDPAINKDRFNVVATLKGKGGGPSLMLNGHMDTVEDLLGWTKPPYGGVLEDGKIYGQGVSNMKASDTAMVYAMSAINKAGVELKGDLLLALVVGECHGGVGTKALMKSGVRTDTFLCTEPTDLNLLTVHAYSQYFRVNITGRTGHPGTHDHGLSAVMKMFELTEKLGPMHKELPPGGWMQFPERNLHHNGLPRYHLGSIKGGLTKEFREGPSNTPDYCSCILNFRAQPTKTMVSMGRDLTRVLETMQEEEPGFQFEVIPMREMLGFESPPESLVVARVAESYLEVMGKKPTVGAIQPFMFMASDSGHMQAAGIADGALIGPGRFTSSVADEHVEVSKLIDAAKIFAASALNICGYHS